MSCKNENQTIENKESLLSEESKSKIKYPIPLNPGYGTEGLEKYNLAHFSAYNEKLGTSKYLFLSFRNLDPVDFENKTE